MRPKVSTASKSSICALAGLLLLVITAGAQDVQIRARVDLVVVPVTVKGDDDLLITGLNKDDFIVYEDGKRQTIANFTIDPVPLSAAVIIDTSLTAESLSDVQETFPALAGAFSAFDEVAVYRFDKYVARVLDFSNDLDQVETAMKALKEIKPDMNPYPNAPGGPFSTAGPVINGAPVVPAGQLGIPSTPRQDIKVLHDAIFTAASDLSKREQDRRKMVLIISDGRTNGNDHSFEEVVNQLLDKGIQVYAIGMDLGFLARRFSVLHDYASTTGGDSYFVTSLHALERCYTKAAETARNQYVLGYISSNKAPAGRPVFREIEVKLARGDFETSHRKGYYQYP